MAFVAAGLVGPAGAVVGIDQSPNAVTKATRGQGSAACPTSGSFSVISMT